MDYFLLALIFILGLMIGSFLNVCIYRIPNGVSIVTPPSRCGACNTRLKPWDLVPVFSWLFLSGKCRYCKAKISVRYLLVELLTGCLFVLVFLVVGLNLYLMPALTLTALLIVVTFIDFDTQTIPNGLIIFGLICAIIFVALSIIPGTKIDFLPNALDALYGALVGFTPLLLVNLASKLLLKKDGMGGGDMKLMAVAGLFLGFKLTLVALIIAIYAGGVVGAIILISSRFKKENHSAEEGEEKTGHYMPFGPFLAIGCFVSMLFGSNILQWYLNLFA